MLRYVIQHVSRESNESKTFGFMSPAISRTWVYRFDTGSGVVNISSCEKRSRSRRNPSTHSRTEARSSTQILTKLRRKSKYADTRCTSLAFFLRDKSIRMPIILMSIKNIRHHARRCHLFLYFTSCRALFVSFCNCHNNLTLKNKRVIDLIVYTFIILLASPFIAFALKTSLKNIKRNFVIPSVAVTAIAFQIYIIYWIHYNCRHR